MAGSILGNRVQRKEDPKFLTSGGVYADDVDESAAEVEASTPTVEEIGEVGVGACCRTTVDPSKGAVEVGGCSVQRNDALVSFDWSGKPRFSATFGPETPGRHRNGSGCNASCVCDGTAVFGGASTLRRAGFMPRQWRPTPPVSTAIHRPMCSTSTSAIRAGDRITNG